MSYDNPLRASYTFNDVDIGAGDATLGVIANGGKTGRVVDITLTGVTEAFTADTTAGFVRLGDGTDDDKFGELDCGTTSAGASATARDSGQAVGITRTAVETTDALTVKVVAPTGGTPAGIGDVNITVEWF